MKQYFLFGDNQKDNLCTVLMCHLINALSANLFQTLVVISNNVSLIAAVTKFTYS